jgi:catalase
MPEKEGAFVSYPEQVSGRKVCERSPSFSDHFSQATLFWNSLSPIEKEHLISAAHFELGKVQNKDVRQRMVDRFNPVDHELAKMVAMGIGIDAPTAPVTENHGQKSEFLSQQNTTMTAKGRKVAILAMDGVEAKQLMAMKQSLKQAGVMSQIVSKFGGEIKAADGQAIPVDKTFLTSASVMFDAVYIPGGKQSINALKADAEAVHFADEAYKHCKAIAATDEGVEFLQTAAIKSANLTGNGHHPQNQGIITAQGNTDMMQVSQAFIEAIAQHRAWMRADKVLIPA